MSIYHLTNENATAQQTLYVTTCYVSGGINISQKLETKELVFEAQNGDLIELSTLPDKGLINQVLKSNGDGSVAWANNNAGITFNGILPTANNQLTLFSGVDGSTIKNSSLVEQDLIDIQTKANNNETDISNLQNDKLNRDGTQSMLGNLDINNNNITNCNNLQTQSIKATDSVSVNYDNNIEMQENEIKSTKAVDFFFNSDSANIGVGSGNLEIRGNNCGLNIYSGMNKYAGLGINDGNNNITLNYITNTVDYNLLDINMNNNNIINCNEVKTDFLASSTNTEVKMNNDLNLNGNNIIGLELINGIQPSGGLYSESSGFSTASTTEINILGQGSSSGSLSIPANGFTALSMYSFKASGVLSGGTNDLFTLRAKSLTGVPSTITLGTIMVTLQDNGLVNVPWDIMIDFTVRSVGPANTASLVLSGCFRYSNNNDVVKSFLRTIVLTTGFDTTVSNSLQLTFQNDAVDPLTNFRIDQASHTKWF